MLSSQTRDIAKATLFSKFKILDSCYQNTMPQQLTEQVLKRLTAHVPFLFKIILRLFKCPLTTFKTQMENGNLTLMHAIFMKSSLS